MTSRSPDEWAEVVRTGCADLAGAPTLVGTLQVDVAGTADGDRSAHAVFDAGSLVAVGEGPADGPDATVTLTAEDARSVLSGDLDPSVAFMQGRMKVAGAMGLVLDVLALATTDGARSVRARIAALAAA